MRLLFTTTSGMGHVMPLLPYADACRRAGHDVLVVGPPPVADVALREGFGYAPVPMPTEDERGPIYRRVRAAHGLERVQIAMRELFVGGYAAAALPALLERIASWRPDAIVHETGEFAALVAGDALRLPTIRVGVALASPFEDWWLRVASEALDELRAAHGLPADPGARRGVLTPLLTLAPPSAERGQGQVPALVRRFRDERVADARATAAPLPGDEDAYADAPLVPISFGTAVPANHFPGIYRDAIDAVADLPIRVLVTTGTEVDPARLGPLPHNVRVERWVPIGAQLARAAAFVTHGGAGTTVAALAAGVPMAVLPLSADQPFNARIVADLGAGLMLEGGPAAAPALGTAVRALLDDPRHRAAAGSVADEIAALPPLDDAVDVIASLAGVDAAPTPPAIAGRGAAQPWTVGTTMSSAMFTRGGAATA